MIPFNKPFLTGNEHRYIQEAADLGKLSGDGTFSRKCQAFLEEKYRLGKCLLTTSCTDALEMAAILLDILPGDEVIMPSFTFVSTANAFVLRGAEIVFADSSKMHPNVDAETIESLITPRTKAIVVVHYAGVACEMDRIMAIAEKYGIYVVEDAAMAIGSYYKGKSVGSIGHLAAFSFHETKNIHCGEGGCLVINDKVFLERAEIIREKGTNRASFFRGEVDKYNWVDMGSSFLPSEINAAFLWAQLEGVATIQDKRKQIWEYYYKRLFWLEEEGVLKLPVQPEFTTNNGHMFYIVLEKQELRNQLIAELAKNQIMAIFHYLPLHQSPFYLRNHKRQTLPNAEKFSETILRLPFYTSISPEEQEKVVEQIEFFFDKVLRKKQITRN